MDEVYFIDSNFCGLRKVTVLEIKFDCSYKTNWEICVLINSLIVSVNPRKWNPINQNKFTVAFFNRSGQGPCKC